jgi:hypothetical protein
MNPRSPTVTLSAAESARLRSLIRDHGARPAAMLVGNVEIRTLQRAASESPIARLTAVVIRHSLDRI